jgi:hypothetical protein
VSGKVDPIDLVGKLPRQSNTHPAIWYATGVPRRSLSVIKRKSTVLSLMSFGNNSFMMRCAPVGSAFAGRGLTPTHEQSHATHSYAPIERPRALENAGATCCNGERKPFHLDTPHSATSAV